MRSFHFNENTETLDSYVTCIRQVATFLGYGEAQVLKVFKNTLPTRLYWVLFHHHHHHHHHHSIFI